MVANCSKYFSAKDGTDRKPPALERPAQRGIMLCMSAKTQPSEKPCNADRSQRDSCVYYHAKTGRCTQGNTTWQEKAAKKG